MPKVELQASKASLEEAGKPSAEERRAALDLAAKQKQAYEDESRAALVREALNGLNNEELDRYLEEQQNIIQEEEEANVESKTPILTRIAERMAALREGILSTHIFVVDGVEHSLDLNGPVIIPTVPPLEKNEYDQTAYLTTINGNEFFICAGNAYLYDPLYFDQGTNVTAHIGKKLGATPDEDQIIVLKMQAGNMEQTPDGEEFIAIDSGQVKNESNFARKHQFTDSSGEKKPLGIHLGEILLDNNEKNKVIIFGDRNVELGPNAQVAYVHIQSLVPGIPLHKFIETETFKEMSELQRVELGQKILKEFQRFEEQTDAYHRDIRPNNIMVDVGSDGVLHVACIDTGTAQKKDSNNRLIGLTIDNKDGVETVYSHPDIIASSKAKAGENWERGFRPAAKIKYEDKHEAFAMRQTLRTIGIEIPLPIPEDDLNTYPNDSFDEITTFLEALKESINEQEKPRPIAPAISFRMRAGNLIENNKLDVTILRANIGSVTGEIGQQISEIIDEYDEGDAFLEFYSAVQLLQKISNKLEEYKKTTANIPPFTDARIDELQSTLKSYVKNYSQRVIDLAKDVKGNKVNYNQLQPLLLNLTNALINLPVALDQEEYVELQAKIEGLTLYLSRDIDKKPEDLIVFRNNLKTIFSDYNIIKDMLKGNEFPLLFKAFDEGLRALQAAIENDLEAISKSQRDFTASKAPPKPANKNKKEKAKEQKSQTVFTFKDPPIVLQWTDCEGDWDKVNRSINALNLYLEQQGIQDHITIDKIETPDGFVEYIKLPEIKGRPIFLNFGGDATDGGRSDIRIKKLLLNTKLQQPNNINLNIGNRDLLDLRYLEELPVIENILFENSLPTWTSQKTFAVFMLEKMASKAIPIIYDDTMGNLTSILKLINTSNDKDKDAYLRTWLNEPSNRELLRKAFASIPDQHIKQFLYMQWADQFTMGRPKRLMYRRQELAFAKRLTGDYPVLTQEFKNHQNNLNKLTSDYQEIVKVFEDLRTRLQVKDVDMSQMILEYQKAGKNAHERQVFDVLYRAILTTPAHDRLKVLTDTFNAMKQEFYDAPLLKELVKFDEELHLYVTDREVVEDIMQSVQKDGLNHQLLKVSTSAGKVGTESAGYISTMHGGPQKEALIINGTKYTNYDDWMTALNDQIHSSIETVITNPTPRTTITPTNQMPDYMRLALPNGKQFIDKDPRNKHCHTGTVIACQCFRFKEIKLSNGQVIKQKVHNIDSEVQQMAVNTGRVYAWLTGHKPTGTDDMGTMDTMILSDGTILSQTSTDISFSPNPQRTCVTGINFGKTTFQQTMVRGIFATANSLVGSITTTLMPTLGLGAPKLMHAPLMVGSTLFAPQFAENNITSFSEHTADKPVFAWNIIDIKYGENSEITAVTMQRMEGENVNITITYQVNAKDLQNLISFTNLRMVESINLSEKQEAVVDSKVGEKPVFSEGATVQINTKLKNSLIEALNAIPKLTTPNLPPLTALSKLILDNIKVQTINLADPETTVILNQQIIGLLSLIEAAKKEPAFKLLLGSRGLEDIQRTLLKAIVVTKDNQDKYRNPSLSFLERAFFEEYRSSFNESIALNAAMNRALANPVMVNTGTDPQWNNISHFFRNALIQISNIDDQASLGLRDIFNEQLIAGEPTTKLLAQIKALDNILEKSKDHTQIDAITAIVTYAKRDILLNFGIELDKIISNATKATTSRFTDIDILDAKISVTQARTALIDTIDALRLIAISSPPKTSYKSALDQEYLKTLDALYDLNINLFSLKTEDIQNREKIINNLASMRDRFAEKDANLDERVRTLFLNALDSSIKLHQATNRIAISSTKEPVFPHSLAEFVELANKLHDDFTYGTDFFVSISQADALEKQLRQAIKVLEESHPNSHKGNNELQQAKAALQLLVKGSNTPTKNGQLELAPGDDGKFALEILRWLPVRNKSLLQKHVKEANELAQAKNTKQNFYSFVEPFNEARAKELQKKLLTEAVDNIELLDFLNKNSGNALLPPNIMEKIINLFQDANDENIFDEFDKDMVKTLPDILYKQQWLKSGRKIREEIQIAIAKDSMGVKTPYLQAALSIIDMLDAANALEQRIKSPEIVATTNSTAIDIRKKFEAATKIISNSKIDLGIPNYVERLQSAAKVHSRLESIRTSLNAINTRLSEIDNHDTQTWSSNHDTNVFLNQVIELLNASNAITMSGDQANILSTEFISNYQELSQRLEELKSKTDLTLNVKAMFEAAIKSHIQFNEQLIKVLDDAPTIAYIKLLTYELEKAKGVFTNDANQKHLYEATALKLQTALYYFDKLHLINEPPVKYVDDSGVTELKNEDRLVIETAAQALTTANTVLDNGYNYEQERNIFANNQGRTVLQKVTDRLFRMAGKPGDFHGGVNAELQASLKKFDADFLKIIGNCKKTALREVSDNDKLLSEAMKQAIDELRDHLTSKLTDGIIINLQEKDSAIKEAIEALSYQKNTTIENIEAILQSLNNAELPRAVKHTIGLALQAKISQLQLENRINILPARPNVINNTEPPVVSAIISRRSPTKYAPVIGEQETKQASKLPKKETSKPISFLNMFKSARGTRPPTTPIEEKRPYSQSIESLGSKSSSEITDRSAQEFSVSNYLHDAEYKAPDKASFTDSFRSVCGFLANSDDSFTFERDTLSRTSGNNEQIEEVRLSAIPQEDSAIEATLSGSTVSWEIILQIMLDSVDGKHMEFRFNKPNETEALNFIRGLLNVAPDVTNCGLKFTFEDTATAKVISDVLQKTDLKDAYGNAYAPEVVSKLEAFLKQGPALKI